MSAISVQEYETRIRQLEKLNATLAAEIDRMRPVVKAAQVLTVSLRRHGPASWSGTEEALERVVTTYEAGNHDGSRRTTTTETTSE